MSLFIDPLSRLGPRLLEVEKPARYAGGEYGSLGRPGAEFHAVMVFPDLYELGMSNQAFRIIYNGLNRLQGISCDRAFAPAPDFEKLLKEEGVPLYGLDTGITLCSADLLLFTLGYELGMGGVLSVLDSGCIALRSCERGEGDPLVIMGGPCVSNPLPYSPFIDAFWIGEAEAGFFELAAALAGMKKKGASRKDLFCRLQEDPHIWVPGKSGVRRAVTADFGREGEAAVFPVPSIKAVQHHGAVEIMRGCPNGCRFCHAGIWYRPMRQKEAGRVMAEAGEFIRKGGYREISLSSLSSGDYSGINELLAALNARYAKDHVSFQLPSLRVSGFSLPLLLKISEVRKGGLTFAVETPGDMEQLSINKEVALDEVVSITAEAKKSGWRGVKFYFMIGLPLPGGKSEEEGIVSFVLEAARRTGSHFHINAGTFVPKAHTPYQWAAQLDEDTAWKKLHHIQDALKPRGHKVSVHNPFMSLLEGIFARGNGETGRLFEAAYKRGCRLDAWSEYMRRDIWKALLEENRELVSAVIRGPDKNSPPPWAVIESGTALEYLAGEADNSAASVRTPPCGEQCPRYCGVCGKDLGIVLNSAGTPEAAGIRGDMQQTDSPPGHKAEEPAFRMLFLFSKNENAVFVSHLGVIEVFSMAVMRAGIRGTYTKGFNPLLKLDFASPAALGLVCHGEIASLDLDAPLPPEEFVPLVNAALPKGFAVHRAELFVIPSGVKKHSPAALLWGFRYGETLVPAAEEKKFRENCVRASAGVRVSAKDCGPKTLLVREAVLAKPLPSVPDSAGAVPGSAGPADYFTLFGGYYGKYSA